MNTPDNHTPTEDIITIPELQEKFAQLQADPEFRKKPFWQRIVEIGALVSLTLIVASLHTTTNKHL